MNTIEWLNRTADYMFFDSPHIYDNTFAAVADLDTHMNFLRTQPTNASISFGNYILARVNQQGFEEFLLTKKVSTLAIFEDEGMVEAYGHDIDVDLPFPDDDL